MQRSPLLLGVAGVALALAASAQAAPCKLADLGWMIGAWRADDATSKSEERWTAGPDGRLVGAAWVLRTDRPGGFIESEMILDEGGHVLMKLRHFSANLGAAWEEKDVPVVFAAAACEPGAVTFDGQGPNTGEHIAYRRDAAGLTFTGDFIHQGKPVRDVITFKPAS